MATKKPIKPARVLVNPPAAKAKGIKQPKHPVMVLFQRRNKAGDLRWHQHILAANGRITSKLAERDGYASLSAVKRAVRQDDENRIKVKSAWAGIPVRYNYVFSKDWWSDHIASGHVIIRKAKK